MKKILIVTTISNTINSFLIPHIELLVKQGYKVDIACNIVQKLNPKIIKLVSKIFNIEFQRSPFKLKNYTAYRKIKRIILTEKYDLIHVHTPIASFLTRLACRNIRKTKVLYTAHGFHFFKGAPLKNWLLYYTMEKLVAKFTDGIITINDEDYKIAKKMKLRGENSVYKVNGVGIDLNKFKSITDKRKIELRKLYGYNETDFILINVAELNSNKNQGFLINVINILKTRVPNIKLILVGEGILMKKYKYKVKKLKLEDYIEFLGYRTDIPNLLAISDIAVSASRREGLPVSIMEAMAIGLPLVVTNCRGNRDLVKNGKNGYLVNFNDIKDFANKIEKLYKSKELRIKFGRKSLEFIKEFSETNIINDMKEIYKNYL